VISGHPNCLESNAFQEISQAEEAIEMYFLKTGSPAHLQWFRVFEPLMVITGIVQPLAKQTAIDGGRKWVS
jgi:hypothetical protein